MCMIRCVIKLISNIAYVNTPKPGFSISIPSSEMRCLGGGSAPTTP